MPSGKKLVLFDIDGTLVSTTDASVAHWKRLINTVLMEVFSVPFVTIDPRRINGKVDYQLMRTIAEDAGIRVSDYERRKPDVFAAFHRELKAAVDSGHITFAAIPEASALVTLLRTKHADTYAIGVVTGNIEKNGWLKLAAGDMKHHFAFGAFADDVFDRAELVAQAIGKARKHFGEAFPVSDVVVIGDTGHDIRAAKANGVRSIGVASGFTHSLEELEKEGADLVVRSLMDERVLGLLGLGV